MAKRALVVAKQRQLDTFNGKVAQDSEKPDVPGGPTDESRKEVILKKAGGGTVAIAVAAHEAAKQKQGELATAFQDATNVFEEWKKELAAEKVKRDGVSNNGTNGLTFDSTGLKSKYDAAALIVAKLVLNHDTKNKAYIALKVTSDLYAARLAILKTLKDAVDKSITDIVAWDSQAGADKKPSTWDSTQTALKEKATALAKNHADWIVTVAAKQTATAGDYERLEGGDKDKKCGDSTPFASGAQNGGADTKIAACRTACTALKYVSFWDGYVKTSVNIVTVTKEGDINKASNQDWKDGKIKITNGLAYDSTSGLALTTTASTSTYDYSLWTTKWQDFYNVPASGVGGNTGADNKILAATTGCTGFTLDGPNNSQTCLLQHTKVPKAASGGAALGTATGTQADNGCYIRMAADYNTGKTYKLAQAAWIKYWDYRVKDYATAEKAFEDLRKTTEAANLAKEVKRLAQKAEFTVEQGKMDAVYNAYKDPTWKDADKLTTDKKIEVDAALDKLSDITWFKAVKTRDEAKVAYDLGLANLKVVTDKIDRLENIMKHMQDAGAGNAGSIADLQKAKEDAEALEKSTGKTRTEAEAALADLTKDLESLTKEQTAALAEHAKLAAAYKAILDSQASKDRDLAIKALRKSVADAQLAFTEANDAENKKNVELGKLVAANVATQAVYDKAVVDCKVKKYNQYILDVEKAKAARNAKIETIEKLIDARKVIAHGETGGRCEKPQSNGDRLRRGKCSSDTDCCGAATGWPHGKTGPLVTIEICRPQTDETWLYVPPRGALQTVDPDGISWPFKCIQGASKLAGAAAAVLASAYMMA